MLRAPAFHSIGRLRSIPLFYSSTARGFRRLKALGSAQVPKERRTLWGYVF